MNLGKAVVHEIHEKHEKNRMPIGLLALTRRVRGFLCHWVFLFVPFVLFVDKKGF